MGLTFECADAEEWKQSLDKYSERLRGTKNEKLISLDDFYREELPTVVTSREFSHITREDLIKIMDWKLTRGKWSWYRGLIRPRNKQEISRSRSESSRPRLLAFVSALDEREVMELSQNAFSSLPDLKAAVETLSKLKGVGAATASAILAAADPECAPFMSDEALQAALGSSKEYTLKHYLLFAEKIKSKASALNAIQKEYHFSASDVERALWSAAAEHFTPKTDANIKKLTNAAKRNTKATTTTHRSKKVKS